MQDLIRPDASFTPRELFARMQGAWFEPRLGYMWQENTGVTPTTSGGQTVGKLVDLSAGRVASQATAANRPLLGARWNLLTTTQTYSGWSITGGVLSDAEFESPVPGFNARLFTESAGGTNHRIFQAIALDASGYQLTAYVKKKDRIWVFIQLETGPTYTGTRAWFNVDTGTVGTVNSPATATITNIGSGWYACAISIPTAYAAGTNNALVGVTTADNTLTYSGDGTSGIYFGGSDLRLSADVGKNPVYQRVTSATDYDPGPYPAIAHGSTDVLVAAMPAINVRRNLLTYTSTLSANWTTANYIIQAGHADPKGDNNAIYIVGANSSLRNPIAIATSTSVVFSVCIKRISGSGVTMLLLRNQTSVVNFDAGNIDPVSGSITGSGWSSENLGNGWYRYKYTRSTGITVGDNLWCYLQASTAFSASDILLYAWPQLEAGSVATDYQKITDWTSEAYSSSGSTYFATPSGMSCLHNQSIGTTYNLPALQTDNYCTVITPARLAPPLEQRLALYMLRLAGLIEPDYLLDDNNQQLTDDSGELLLRA